MVTPYTWRIVHAVRHGPHTVPLHRLYALYTVVYGHCMATVRTVCPQPFGHSGPPLVPRGWFAWPSLTADACAGRGLGLF